jgi:hypothetical protein
MRDILNVLRYLWLALFCSVVVRCENQTYARRNQTEDILQYVDPLVGTSAGGKMLVIQRMRRSLTDVEQAMFSPEPLCPLVGSCHL